MRRFTLFCLLFFAINAFSQTQRALPLAKYGDNLSQPLTAKERAFIDEVYGQHANKFVYSNPHRLKAIKHILRNRVVIKEMMIDDPKKAYPKLSKVPLQTGFVSNLKRDKIFNPEDFNPLKYQFKFYARGGAGYRVDGTNYHIFIKSQF
ncbi:hypothetical protein DFQ05_0164 [Winogradskyella wandonensis]|uniref:L,D-transpeptidase-like protein n=1 Tax=Winogradskyella wandonensis TaxID=1442586 RepID=A0A4R1KTY3_9FLAO|nr:hypothetical protein [Winogradskyella wandonensis]TCK68656.1 hypothetical protein DFQ05_0164 [Winogradskyella wandonensis]